MWPWGVLEHLQRVKQVKCDMESNIGAIDNILEISWAIRNVKVGPMCGIGDYVILSH